MFKERKKRERAQKLADAEMKSKMQEAEELAAKEDSAQMKKK